MGTLETLSVHASGVDLMESASFADGTARTSSWRGIASLAVGAARTSSGRESASLAVGAARTSSGQKNASFAVGVARTSRVGCRTGILSG